MYSSRGFTLIEVVITVAIIAALFTSSVPIFQKLQIRNDMNTAVATAAQAMRPAHTLSQSGTSDTTFGVYLQA